MDFTQLASQLLSDKLGLDINQDTMKSALTSLLGDGGGGIDFAGLASRMASNGQLGSVLKSWLGDGANDAISADSIMDLLGRRSWTRPAAAAVCWKRPAAWAG